MADSPYRREGVPRAANPDPHAGYRRQAEHRFGTPPGQLGAQARQAPPPGGGTRGDQAAVMRSRMLLTAAGVLAIGAVLHLMKFVFAAAFGSAGAVLLLILLAAGGAYAWYRTQRGADAKALEDQMTRAARTAATIVTNHAKSAWNHKALTTQPAPPAHVAQSAQPVWGGPPAAATAPDSALAVGGLVSALLLIPSLVVYAILGNAAFTSPWQPWWLLTGLNVYFVVCVAVRARTDDRRGAVLLVALAGMALYGLVSSPSSDWSLAALLSEEKTIGGYTYSEPPYELLPWIGRVPVLVAVLFVVAWSVARRAGSSWWLGLLPTGGLAWWSIWYSEQGMRTPPNWFTFWLLEVGVFVGGCLACVAAGALSRINAPQQP